MNRQQRRATTPDEGAEALHQRGIAAYQAGRFGAAVKAISQAIAADEGNPLYHFNLARLHEEQGRRDMAMLHYRRAVALYPGYAEAHNNLGAVLRAAGLLEEAIGAFRQALAVRPDFAFAHHNLGCALAARGETEAAIECLHTALRYAPLYAEAYFNLGNIYVQWENFTQAAQNFANALQLRPDWPEALNNLGVAFAGLEQWGNACAVYLRALELRPRFADALYNLGKAYKAQGRLGEAISAYRATLHHHPSHAQAENNLGIALDQSGAFEEAEACFRRAIALAPDFADAHYNLGTALLTRGDFAAGWPEFEWRFATTQMRGYTHRSKASRWKGESGGGRVLLIHAEQGFGDTIQFCRFAPLAAARGWQVVLEAPAALTRLLAALPGISQVITTGDDVPAHDAQVPMLSLPLAFGTTLESIPAATPYLCVPDAHIAAWAAKLPPGSARKIGLVWAGNQRRFSRVLAEVDQRRSIAPEKLAPLFTIPDCQFISLQKDGPAMPPALPLLDLMPEVTDFADTAALIMTLDLVISVDTATAHLAAALGKPVWLLNRFDACWRWLPKREDSPWYPTMRLFNQPAPGDWERVIDTVMEALSK